MAENKNLFRQESIERMQSPEKTDEYIRVSTPKAWILVISLSLVVTGVIVWGFIGSIPKTVSVSGVMVQEYDGDVLCLLPVDVAGQYLLGHESHITLPDGSGIKGTVDFISKDPLSYEEVGKMTSSDWRLRSIWGEENAVYKYAVGIKYDKKDAQKLVDRELVTVSVVLSDIRPIEYILN